MIAVQMVDIIDSYIHRSIRQCPFLISTFNEARHVYTSHNNNVGQILMCFIVIGAFASGKDFRLLLVNCHFLLDFQPY